MRMPRGGLVGARNAEILRLFGSLRSLYFTQDDNFGEGDGMFPRLPPHISGRERGQLSYTTTACCMVRKLSMLCSNCASTSSAMIMMSGSTEVKSTVLTLRSMVSKILT